MANEQDGCVDVAFLYYFALLRKRNHARKRYGHRNHKGCHDNSFAKRPSHVKRTCQFAGILANLAGLQFKRQKDDVRMVVMRVVGCVCVCVRYVSA
jgi:hypothetical protein